MPRGVMVAREILDLFVKVRVLARQPLSHHKRLTLPNEVTNPRVRTGISISFPLSADVPRCLTIQNNCCFSENIRFRDGKSIACVAVRFAPRGLSVFVLLVYERRSCIKN